MVKLSTPLSTLMALMAPALILSRTLKPVQGSTLLLSDLLGGLGARAPDRTASLQKPAFQKTVDNPAWDAIIGASAPNHYLPLPIIVVPSLGISLSEGLRIHDSNKQRLKNRRTR